MVPRRHTVTRFAGQVLLAAAPGSTASLPLGVYARGRAVVDAADAGAILALTTARLAATAALTLVAASVLAADGGGHEGQCHHENQTVHGKILCIETLNRSLHVTTCERGKAIARVHPHRRTHVHGRENTNRRAIQFRQTP